MGEAWHGTVHLHGDKKEKTWLQLVIGRQISGHEKKGSCGKMNNNPNFCRCRWYKPPNGSLIIGTTWVFCGSLGILNTSHVCALEWMELGPTWASPIPSTSSAPPLLKSKEIQQIFPILHGVCSPKPPRRSDFSHLTKSKSEAPADPSSFEPKLMASRTPRLGSLKFFNGI